MKLNRQNPTQTNAWQALEKHYEKEMQNEQIKNLFAKDAQRFDKFSLRFNNMLIDFSKNIINEKTLKLLLQLAEETKVADGIEKCLQVAASMKPKKEAFCIRLCAIVLAKRCFLMEKM